MAYPLMVFEVSNPAIMPTSRTHSQNQITYCLKAPERFRNDHGGLTERGNFGLYQRRIGVEISEIVGIIEELRREHMGCFRQRAQILMTPKLRLDRPYACHLNGFPIDQARNLFLPPIAMCCSGEECPSVIAVNSAPYAETPTQKIILCGE